MPKSTMKAITPGTTPGNSKRASPISHGHTPSFSSNHALGLATGEFVGLLDHDDELPPDALFEVVKRLNKEPDLDLLYSDEDKLELDGQRVEPFFKPDWSPDLLLSGNYIAHFSVFRGRLLEEVGRFRLGCPQVVCLMTCRPGCKR